MMGDAGGVFALSVFLALLFRLPLMLLEGGFKIALFSRYVKSSWRALLPPVAGIVVLETLASLLLVGGLSLLDSAGRIAGAFVVTSRGLLVLWLISLGLLVAAVFLVNALFMRRVRERHLHVRIPTTPIGESLLFTLLFFATSGLHDLWAYLSIFLGLFPVGP